MVTYGFYNSLNGDRKYDATQMSTLFDGIIKDGVFQSIGSALVVTAPSGNMTVQVGTGRAWFNHTWTLNDSPLNLKISAADSTLPRIDAVVLEVNSDETVRENSFKVIKGTPATSPTNPKLTNTKPKWQYPLCYVRVNAGTTKITNANITNNVGTAKVPFITGVLKTLTLDDVLGQWRSELDEFVAERTAYINNFYAELESYFGTEQINFADWRTTQQTNFEAWFNGIKGQITEDAATNLLMKLDNTVVNSIFEAGLPNGVTSFPSNNKIVQTDGTNTLTTTIQTSGDVVEVLEYEGVQYTKTTQFNSDGTITEARS